MPLLLVPHVPVTVPMTVLVPAVTSVVDTTCAIVITVVGRVKRA